MNFWSAGKPYLSKTVPGPIEGCKIRRAENLTVFQKIHRGIRFQFFTNAHKYVKIQVCVFRQNLRNNARREQNRRAG